MLLALERLKRNRLGFCLSLLRVLQPVVMCITSNKKLSEFGKLPEADGSKNIQFDIFFWIDVGLYFTVVQHSDVESASHRNTSAHYKRTITLDFSYNGTRHMIMKWNKPDTCSWMLTYIHIVKKPISDQTTQRAQRTCVLNQPLQR